MILTSLELLNFRLIMKNLIPNFIQEKFKDSVFKGSFMASTVFIDISGFTKMTETLMKSGDEGAEVLSEILNQIFNPVVNAIYENGGFVTTFAGDAFTSVFPENNSQTSAIFSAQKIQKVFAKKGLMKTKFGDFQLAVKLGISFGLVEWGILGKERKAYFFRGEAIDNCAASEHLAEKGEVVFDNKIFEVCESETLDFAAKSDVHFALKKLNLKKRKQNFPSTKRLLKKIALEFLPKSVVDFSQSGEFRNVSSVFVSFDGAESFENLSELISLLSEIIFYYKGYFNKLDFGDKGGIALCVFGAPISYENLTSFALKFSLALQKSVKKNLPTVKIRLGITYGKVYAGFVGGQKRLEYTVLGDVVNLAARLMASADWEKIWVSENINFLEKNNFEFENLGEFQFKGKSKKEKVFELKSQKIIDSAVFKGKFVGRENELSVVAKSFLPLEKDSFGGAVYVYGEAGVGKSRFIYELQKQNSNFTWLHFSCDGIQKKPFNPLRSFFLNLFQLETHFSTEQNKANFEKNYETLFTANEEINNELSRLKTVIGCFLGIHFTDSLYDELDPKLRYENTILSFAMILQALSVKNPVVVNFEDIHWIDSDSEKALQKISKVSSKFPLIFLFPCRYHDDNSKPKIQLGAIETQEIDLNRLSDERILQFSENSLEGRISIKLFAILKKRTEGNPFFIEQSLLFFREEKVIQNVNGRWEILKEEFALPLTINDLLISRIDRLAANLKEIIQTASVIGNEFELKLLSEVLQHKDFSCKLQKGEEADIWHALSELRYIFSHILMHEAVYQMQLKKRVRELHRLVAESIEKLFQGEKNYFADLAFHYQKAEIKSKSIEYLEKAGDYASENFQNSKALEFYENLLGLLENSEAHFIDVLLKKSEILAFVGRRNEVQSHYSLALSISERIKDETRIAKSKKQLGILASSRGEFLEANSWLQSALSTFVITKNEKEESVVNGVLGLIAFQKGQLEEAKHFYNKQLEICERTSNERGISRVYGNLGMVFHVESNFQKAIESYAVQKRITEKLKDRRGFSRAVNNIGFAFAEQGNFENALQNYKEYLSICQTIGDKQGIAISSKNIGSIFLEKEDYQNAEKNYSKAISIAKELEIPFFLADFLICRAEFFFRTENFSAAKKDLTEGLSFAQKIGKTEQIFKGKLLNTKIKLSETNGKNGVQELLDLLESTKNADQTAILNFEIHKANEKFKLGLSQEFKNAAQKQLNEIWRKTSKFEFKRMMEKF